jgi:hypothetical protein
MHSIFNTWDKKLYTGLRFDEKSIRLVEILPGSSEEIRIKLSVRPLDEVETTYDALSYVWWPPKPAKTIWVHDIEVSVSPTSSTLFRQCACRMRGAAFGLMLFALIKQAY